jgi:secondary thiamine-phosphate synthase enzyme
MVLERRLSISLPAEFGHRDITPEVARWVAEAGVITGLAAIQVVGSTGGITTIEYESGALADLQRSIESLAPADGHYEHNARWGDGNGFSHVRSALLKTALTLPIVDGRLQLGTWQQIVVLNFDNRPREREVAAVIYGSTEPA